jgi:hypothetical protein
MRHPARGPKLCLGIDGKSNAASRRHATPGVTTILAEAAA